MSSFLPLPSRTAEVSELLDSAYGLFKRALPSCLPLAMAAVLVAESATLYWLGTGHAPGRQPPADPVYWALELAGTLLYLLLAAALVLRLNAVRRGRLTRLRDDLAVAGRRWVVLVSATVLATLIIALGVLALILPGIYLAVCLAPLTAVVLLEPLTPVAAIRRCLQLVRPMWIKVFACLLIAALIIIVCLFTVGLISSLLLYALVGSNAQLANALGTAVLMAVMAAVQVFLFALCLTIYSAASSSA
jgi:hypothetical protein